jgi:hypothetical protein
MKYRCAQRICSYTRALAVTTSWSLRAFSDVGATGSQPNALVSAAPEVATPVIQPGPPETSGAPLAVMVLPQRYNEGEISVPAGEELMLVVDVQDPNKRPVKVDMVGLPNTARFEPQTRTFIWSPRDDEQGKHHIRLNVTAEGTEVSRMLVLNVVGNRPPIIGNLSFEAVAGGAYEWSVDARDPEGKAVVVTVNGLPEGATVKDGVISFHPTSKQLGEHPIELSASDGGSMTTRSGTITVTAQPAVHAGAEEWESFWLPGAGYSVFAPRDAAVGELFHGLSLEIVMAAWIHHNDNRGPSHGRVYINAELLNSDIEDTPLLFTYAAGLSLSFERNPERNWLIPYYCLELGGMIHRELGGLFQATPHLGLHLFSNQNLFLGARVGYRLVPSRIDSMAGVHAAITADFSIW